MTTRVATSPPTPAPTQCPGTAQGVNPRDSGAEYLCPERNTHPRSQEYTEPPLEIKSLILF